MKHRAPTFSISNDDNSSLGFVFFSEFVADLVRLLTRSGLEAEAKLDLELLISEAEAELDCCRSPRQRPKSIVVDIRGRGRTRFVVDIRGRTRFAFGLAKQ